MCSQEITISKPKTFNTKEHLQTNWIANEVMKGNLNSEKKPTTATTCKIICKTIFVRSLCVFYSFNATLFEMRFVVNEYVCKHVFNYFSSLIYTHNLEFQPQRSYNHVLL